MVTVQQSFSAVTNPVTTVNDRWLAINLSAANITMLFSIKENGKTILIIFFKLRNPCWAKTKKWKRYFRGFKTFKSRQFLSKGWIFQSVSRKKRICLLKLMTRMNIKTPVTIEFKRTTYITFEIWTVHFISKILPARTKMVYYSQ